MMTNIFNTLDLTLKSIPERSPVLPHSVVYLGGMVDILKPTYTLLKDNCQILIEGPPLDPKATARTSHEHTDFRNLTIEHQRYLSIIEGLIRTIDFGATNRAHLIEDNDGEYRIIQDQKIPMSILCSIWGPKIYMDEIQITVWGEGFDRRRGIWNGKDVDIFYALHDWDRLYLHRAMKALRHLDGRSDCDLTFEFYGHLMDRDGTILGLITEAATGRYVQLGDEDLVSTSLKHLTQFGCLYQVVATNQFLISGGKLRLLCMEAIMPYDDKQELKKDAEYYHKWALGELFEEFRDYGPYGDHKFLPYRLTRRPEELIYIAMLPSPERPLDCHYGWKVTFAFNFDDDQRPFETKAMRRPQRKGNYLLYNRKDSHSVHGNTRDHGQTVYSRVMARSTVRSNTQNMRLPRARKLQELSSTEGTASIIEAMIEEVDD